MYVVLPLNIGSLKTDAVVAVVPANVPLLIWKAKLKEWGAVIDFERSSLFLKKTDEEMHLEESDSGHLMINVGKTIDKNADEVIG